MTKLSMVARKRGYNEEDDVWVYDILVEGRHVGQLGMGEETYEFRSSDVALRNAVRAHCTGDMSLMTILGEIRKIIEGNA